MPSTKKATMSWTPQIVTDVSLKREKAQSAHIDFEQSHLFQYEGKHYQTLWLSLEYIWPTLRYKRSLFTWLKISITKRFWEPCSFKFGYFIYLSFQCFTKLVTNAFLTSFSTWCFLRTSSCSNHQTNLGFSQRASNCCGRIPK